jgi:sugar lactone lactonase YvrE
MVILLVCIIIFFYFIRRNYFQEGKYLKEGFLDTTGEIAGVGTDIANPGPGTSNICFNKVDGNFYIAVRGGSYKINDVDLTSDAKIIKMTPSGQITNLVTPGTTITGTTKKLEPGDGNGPCGVCADTNGNIYFNSQKNNQIYKIPYGSTTPELFASAPSGSSRPMGMCCGTNNIIWVVYANGTSVVVGYNTDKSVNAPI